MKIDDKLMEKIIDEANRIHQQTTNQQYAYIPIQPKTMVKKSNRIVCHCCGQEFKLNEQTVSICNSKICEVNNDNRHFEYNYPGTKLVFHYSCFRLLCGEEYYSIMMKQLGNKSIP